MVYRIKLEAEEKRSGADGDAVYPYSNRPWEEVTADVIADGSLLEASDDLGDAQVLDIKREVTKSVQEELRWYFETYPSGTDPVIVDVVKDEHEKVMAILQWQFNYRRLNGQGGHGANWEEARATLDLNDKDAALIVAAMNLGISAKQKEMLERKAYYDALGQQGLDDESIKLKQEECLRAAGLDWETLGGKREAFRQSWESGMKRDNE